MNADGKTQVVDDAIDERIRKSVHAFCRRRPRWQDWESDIVQELRAEALEAGVEAAKAWSMRIHILQTLDRWFGRCRYERHLGGREEVTETGDMAELVAVAPVDHMGRIAWARLREQWLSMSAHEKAGVYAIVCGHTCEELGVPQQTLHRGKVDAIGRIDSPASFAATKAAHRAANAKSAKERYHARMAAQRMASGAAP
jgi:hypothetical protein